MFCSECGQPLEGARFCKTCGHAVGALSTPAPGPVPRTGAATIGSVEFVAPTLTNAAGLSTENRRPRWVLPALVGGVVLLVVAAVLGGFAVLRGDGAGSGASSARLVDEAKVRIVPVRNANEGVRDALRSLAGADALPAVARSAATLRTAARDARIALEAVGEGERGSTGASTSLAAVGSYGIVLEGAARSLTPASVARAEAARDDVIAKQARLSSQDPTLAAAMAVDVPSVAALRVVQRKLEAERASAAAAAARKRAETNAARTAARGYVQRIDRLLVESARTRRDLGQLINGVTTNTMPYYQASAEISAIISQRQGLQNAVSTVLAPPEFTRAANLLSSSIAAAIDDDKAIQGWIGAWYAADQYTFDRYWTEHQRATSHASAAKAAFVAEYDRVRRRFGLGRLSVGSSY